MKTPLDPVERFKIWSILDAAYRSVFKARQRELMDDGILIMQLRVLAMIQTSEDEPTPANLARLLRRKPHTISQIIGRMVKAGLVRKAPSRQYRNRVCIQMTEQGEAIYLRSRERQSFNRIMSHITPKKRELLASLLEEIWGYAQLELPEADRLEHPWDYIYLADRDAPRPEPRAPRSNQRRAGSPKTGSPNG